VSDHTPPDASGPTLRSLEPLCSTGRCVVERQVLCTSAFGAPLTVWNRFLVTVGDELSSFKEGHVVSICVFGVVRPRPVVLG
jgi:hypothetical protein